MRRNRRSFTLIELVMVMVILGITAAAGAVFFAPMMKLYFFTPSQSAAQQGGNLIKDNIIEGNASGKGLRVIKNITAATATSISYIDADERAVSITWNGTTYKFSRTTPGGTSLLPLENPGSDIKVDGQASGILFRYFDSSQNELSSPVATPANIARIELNWVVFIGTGSIDNYEGRFLVNSGIHIKQF